MSGRRHKRLRKMSVPKEEESRFLQELLHIGGVSIQGLGQILKKLRLDVPCSALYDANHARFLAIRHIERVPMLGKAADFEWELAHPGRLVSTVVAECPELERL